MGLEKTNRRKTMPPPNDKEAKAAAEKLAKKKKTPTIVKSKTEKLLRVELTEAELLDAGQKMADAQQTTVSLNAELQSFKEQMKGKLAEAEGAAVRYGALVRQKYEHRPVECELQKNYKLKKARLIRLDTNQIVEERPMTQDELATLPMGD
jgi:hypothetical protein